MKNNDVINEIKQDGWDIKKLINVNAKVAFYHGDSDDYIGIRVYLPKIIADQIEKAKRAGNYDSMEIEERERGEENHLYFLPDGTAVFDTGFIFVKEN